MLPEAFNMRPVYATLGSTEAARGALLSGEDAARRALERDAGFFEPFFRRADEVAAAAPARAAGELQA